MDVRKRKKHEAEEMTAKEVVPTTRTMTMHVFFTACQVPSQARRGQRQRAAQEPCS